MTETLNMNEIEVLPMIDETGPTPFVSFRVYSTDDLLSNDCVLSIDLPGMAFVAPGQIKSNGLVLKFANSPKVVRNLFQAVKSFPEEFSIEFSTGVDDEDSRWVFEGSKIKAISLGTVDRTKPDEVQLIQCEIEFLSITVDGTTTRIE